MHSPDLTIGQVTRVQRIEIVGGVKCARRFVRSTIYGLTDCGGVERTTLGFGSRHPTSKGESESESGRERVSERERVLVYINLVLRFVIVPRGVTQRFIPTLYAYIQYTRRVVLII